MFMIPQMNRLQAWLMPLTIVCLVTFINLIFAYSYQFFVGDDWDWLYFAQFSSFGNLFSFWPQAIYNDRPVGAMMIKVMYLLFDLNSSAFYLFQLALHILNCLLLFWIAKKYIGSWGALIAATLAGTWVVANDAVFWTAAIFDLLGGTLCLLAIFLWQFSGKQYRWFWTMLGAVIYFFAIRTKEFSISLPFIILAIAWLLENEKLKPAFKRLWPYWLVLVVMGIWYLRLMLNTSIVGSSDAYGLHFSGLLDNLQYYLGTLFYENLWEPDRRVWNAVHIFMVCSSLLLLGLAIGTSNQYRKVALVAIIGFLALLGPTLLLKNHLGQLYLYAPHFFLAFAIGGLFSLGALWQIPTILLTSLLIAIPLGSTWFHEKTIYYVSRTQQSADQYHAFQRHLKKIKPGAQVFIADLAQWNPLDYQGGKPLMVMKQDSSLRLHAHLPAEQLIEKFCQVSEPKIYIRMEGIQAFDETSLIVQKCPK